MTLATDYGLSENTCVQALIHVAPPGQIFSDQVRR